ncbi:hypothetical protein KIN20_027998 [Parelaphostrongylus tenuis]|uniref:Uncharacterized protein n=1 Tax=Parelaphostrongylus tenuis TaxID=148309 RepID=A0AAD5WEC1_PARTN|nr:hypothetical protein KIN20_027998 [Parelaphostrongylus tenuis]
MSDKSEKGSKSTTTPVTATATTPVDSNEAVVAANSNVENCGPQKKQKHTEKSKEKLKEMSRNIQSQPAQSFQSRSHPRPGSFLPNEVQREVRTGKVPVNEVMGADDGGQTSTLTKSSQSNPSVGQTIMHRPIGNNVDPEAIFTAALRQMPQIPGFPSLIHRPDSRPSSAVFLPELFKTTMEAYAAHCNGTADIFDALRKIAFDSAK